MQTTYLIPWLAAAALLLIPHLSQAQEATADANAGANSSSTSGATSGAILDADVNTIVVFEGTVVPTSTKVKITGRAAAAVAPGLTTTLTETCHGSSSIGGAVSGFGLSLGSTWADQECVVRLNARDLRQTDPVMALAVTCLSKVNRKASDMMQAAGMVGPCSQFDPLPDAETQPVETTQLETGYVDQLAAVVTPSKENHLDRRADR